MQSITKPLSFADMMDCVFKAYIPMVKNMYLILFGVFLISLIPFTTFAGNFLYSVASFLLYSFGILKANALVTGNNNGTLSQLLKRFILFILMCNVVMLVLFVIMFSLFIWWYPIFHYLFGMPINDAAEGWIMLWLFFSAIITALVGIYFFFSNFIFWVEKKGVFRSIADSCRLVKGKWWYTTLSLSWFTFIFGLPYGMISGIIFELGLNPAEHSQSFLSLVGFGIMNVIYYPIFVAAPLYLYYNLKSRSKERQL